MPHKSGITLIKFGGAVITNKEIPNQVRPEHLHRLVVELADVWERRGDQRFVLGNGVGSFAHVPAAHYQTMQGFINDESRIGMAITQNSAAWINRIVVKACIESGLPAVTWAPSNSVMTDALKVTGCFNDILATYLEKDLLPVTHGDVIVDATQGCTIWSTDKVFTFLAQQFQKQGQKVVRIVHVTEAEGVWQMKDGEWSMAGDQRVIYQKITPDMRDEVKTSMAAIKGFDVTGGMWHKIEEALELTKIGIQTQIISGLVKGNLVRALTSNQPLGTLITA